MIITFDVLLLTLGVNIVHAVYVYQYVYKTPLFCNYRPCLSTLILKWLTTTSCKCAQVGLYKITCQCGYGGGGWALWLHTPRLDFPLWSTCFKFDVLNTTSGCPISPQSSVIGMWNVYINTVASMLVATTSMVVLYCRVSRIARTCTKETGVPPCLASPSWGRHLSPLRPWCPTPPTRLPRLTRTCTVTTCPMEPSSELLQPSITCHHISSESLMIWDLPFLCHVSWVV